MKDIQQEVDEWINLYKVGYFPVFEQIARLTEEVGELSREISHRYGLKKKKETEDIADLEGELGDVLFTLTCIANALNLDMKRGFDATMNKLKTRDKDRWEKK